MDGTGIFFVVCLFSGLCVFLSGICLLMVIKQRDRFKKFRLTLNALEHALEVKSEVFGGSPAVSGAGRENQRPDFSELRARFENKADLRENVPEKYRYVARLDRSGLSAGELADILDVSADEAAQMLALARLSQSG